MYVCNCFGVTEDQVKQHAAGGACTPRQIASACKAGTDCGSCVRRIQALLGRGGCAPRRALDSVGSVESVESVGSVGSVGSVEAHDGAMAA